MKKMNTNNKNTGVIKGKGKIIPKETSDELSRSQIAAKIAAKNGITKTMALAIVEQIAELARITIPDDADLARQALIKENDVLIEEMEEKLEAKLKRTFDAACKVAIKACRSRIYPASPVILFGAEGFYFGDDYTSGDCSVCDDLGDDFADFDGDTDPDGIMPNWSEVYDWTKTNLFINDDGWLEALKKALKTGDYSVLIY